MKKIRTHILPVMLCYLLLFITTYSHADQTGKLQFLYTAYLDVPGLISKTLASCEQFDPSTRVELQNLYDQWNQKHGRYQNELQQLLFKFLSQEMGAEKAQEFVTYLKVEVDKEIASLHFPQNHTWQDNWFCTKLLPEDLTGKGLMLDYADYVKELQQNLDQLKQLVE